MRTRTITGAALRGLLPFIVVAALAASCQREEAMPPSAAGGKTISFTIAQFSEDGDAPSTRTSISSGGAFTWAEGDTVGIYPNTGGQVYFEMTAGAGAKSAEVDGGGWDFKPSAVYRSYYPFIGDIYLDRANIPVDFSGQRQTGNNSTSHIGPYDFMCTPATSASDGKLSFAYEHLICVLKPVLTLPAGTYDRITLSVPDGSEPFVVSGHYDLSSDSPEIIGGEFSSSVAIDLDVTVEATSDDGTGQLTAFIVTAPADLTGKSLLIEARNSGGQVFYATTPEFPRALAAGKIYPLSFSMTAGAATNEIWYTADKKLPYRTLPTGVTAHSYSEDTHIGVLTFENTVTEVTSSLFKNNKFLLTVTLPNSVETIADEAFSGCTNLSQINFPESLKEIGYNAFKGCDFEEINLPNGLEAIGYMAFGDCDKLKSVTIPQSVKYLGTYPGALNAGASFYNCSSLEAFYGKFASDDHKCLIAETGTEKFLNSFASAGMDGKTYTIPEGVTYISPYAFYKATINGVEFPSSLSKILGCAFSESGLKSVTIPATVTQLGPFVFESCSQMQWIKIEGDNRVIQPVQNFGSLGYFFYETNDCPIYVPASLLEWYKTADYWKVYASRYQTILADNEIRYTTTDGEKLKFNSDSDASILGSWYSSSTYENGVGTITHDGTITEIPESLFKRCTNLKSVTLPDGVLNIQPFAFAYCQNLESVTFGNNVQTIEDGAFAFCPLTSLSWPGSLTTLGHEAFKSSHCTSVNIPSSITTIQGNPFSGSPNLEAFTGDSPFISSDGRYLSNDGVMYSFAGGGLTEYTVPSEIKTVGAGAMFGCGLQKVVFSEGLEKIEQFALFGCNELTDITIPASVTEILTIAFESCPKLTTLRMEGPTPPTSSSLFSSSTLDNEDFSIEIPGAGCTSYRTASYWSDLESHFVCYQADNEIWYHLANNESTTIGNTDGDFGANYLREDVVALKAIKDVRPTINISSAYDNLFRVMVFDGDVTSVGDHFFDTTIDPGSAKLDWCSLPFTVTQIGDAAFKGCTKLGRMPIVAGWANNSYFYSYNLTSIGNEAFNGCSSMVLNFYEPHDENFNVAYFSGLTSIGDMAFKNCSSLDLEIRFMESSVSIGADAFENSSLPGLRNSTSAKIGTGAFKNCKALTTATIGRITSISDSTFAGCSNLEKVTLVSPQTLTSVGNYAFYKCTALTTIGNANTEEGTVYLPGITTAGENAFCQNAFSKASFDNLSSLENYVLNTCTNLSELYVPKVTKLAQYPLQNTQALKSLSLPKIETLTSYSFAYSKLAELHLGSTLRDMSGKGLFANFLNDGNLIVYFEGNTPPTFGNSAFYRAGTHPVVFKSIHVPKSCKEAYVEALTGANSAYSVYADVIVEDPDL